MWRSRLPPARLADGPASTSPTAPAPGYRKDTEDIRELVVDGHRLIYWTDGERVTVLAVVPGRRDFESISPKPWE